MDAKELGRTEVYPNDGGGVCAPSAGISLRQHYAGLAMVAMAKQLQNLTNGELKDIAVDSVRLADALLAALSAIEETK